VRAISCAFAFIICYFNAFLASRSATFGSIYADMLGGSPCRSLPRSSAGQSRLIALSLALPLAALLRRCLIRSHRLALSIVGTVLVIALSRCTSRAVGSARYLPIAQISEIIACRHASMPDMLR